MFVSVLHFIHQRDVVIPSDLCKRHLHNFLIWKAQSEFGHIFKVPSEVVSHIWKRNLYIRDQIFNEPIPPRLRFFPLI